MQRTANPRIRVRFSVRPPSPRLNHLLEACNGRAGCRGKNVPCRFVVPRGNFGNFRAHSPFTEPCSLAWISMSEKNLGPAQSYRYNPRALNGARPFRGSSAVEQSAVNRSVVGSNPTPGAIHFRPWQHVTAAPCRCRTGRGVSADRRFVPRQTLTVPQDLRQNCGDRTLPADRPASADTWRLTAGRLRSGRAVTGIQHEEALLDEHARPRRPYDPSSYRDIPAAPGQLMRPALLALACCGLLSCNSAYGPPAATSTDHAVAAAAPAALARPPVPKRKPPTPNVQTASIAGPEAIPPAPEVAMPPETNTGVLVPSPSTPEVPNDVVGMDSSGVERSLGPPDSRRDVPPAVVWQYANAGCGLDIWLYRDLQSGALRALFVEVKGDDRTEQRRQYCIKQLALQSAGGQSANGTRRLGTDETAPR